MEKLRHDLYRTDMKRGNKINYMLEKGDEVIVQDSLNKNTFSFMSWKYNDSRFCQEGAIAIFRVVRYKDKKIEEKKINKRRNTILLLIVAITEIVFMIYGVNHLFIIPLAVISIILAYILA